MSIERNIEDFDKKSFSSACRKINGNFSDHPRQGFTCSTDEGRLTNTGDGLKLIGNETVSVTEEKPRKVYTKEQTEKERQMAIEAGVPPGKKRMVVETEDTRLELEGE